MEEGKRRRRRRRRRRSDDKGANETGLSYVGL